MANASDLSVKYDRAAPAWGDKMRLLGYSDAYLGFLASEAERAASGQRVLDIGCGSGAFADVWAAMQGPDHAITLLDPSREMLRRADAQLKRRGVNTELAQCLLEDHSNPAPYTVLLAAHVIEHVPDPVACLRKMRDLADEGAQLWLIVSKPHWCNAIIWFQWRHKAYAPESVRRFLSQSGWELSEEYAFPSGPPSRTSRGYLARAL